MSSSFSLSNFIIYSCDFVSSWITKVIERKNFRSNYVQSFFTIRTHSKFGDLHFSSFFSKF